jgi:hypothetical protein
MQTNCGVWSSKILLVIHENIVCKVFNAKILSMYQPSYFSEMFIRCRLTNELTQTLTSQSGVGANPTTIEEGHGK